MAEAIVRLIGSWDKVGFPRLYIKRWSNFKTTTIICKWNKVIVDISNLYSTFIDSDGGHTTGATDIFT